MSLKLLKNFDVQPHYHQIQSPPKEVNENMRNSSQLRKLNDRFFFDVDNASIPNM